MHNYHDDSIRILTIINHIPQTSVFQFYILHWKIMDNIKFLSENLAANASETDIYKKSVIL